MYFNGDPTTGFYNPGTYEVEVRAWADDDFDTEYVELLTIEVIDPCLTAVLTIDDTVFKTKPELTLLQFVKYDALQIQWTDSIITAEFNTCGPFTHEIWSIDNGTQVLDPAVFPSKELTTTTKSLNV